MTQAEELARFIWPDATPEEIRILAEALRKGFSLNRPGTSLPW